MGCLLKWQAGRPKPKIDEAELRRQVRSQVQLGNEGELGNEGRDGGMVGTPYDRLILISSGQAAAAVDFDESDAGGVREWCGRAGEKRGVGAGAEDKGHGGLLAKRWRQTGFG